MKRPLHLLVSLSLAAACCPAAKALSIVPTYDSSITSDPNAVAIEVGIFQAILQVQAAVLTPITVSIKFVKIDTDLGQNETIVDNHLSYSQYLSDLALNQPLSANDNIALAHLPAGPNNPINGDPNVYLTLPLLRAIGETALGDNGGDFDSTISLNISRMNLITTVPPDPAKYDLVAATIHEVDEVLGIGGSGSIIGRPVTAVGSLDLFRFSSNGVRSFTTSSTATAYFSIDGGATNLVNFNQTGNGSDYGDWGPGIAGQETGNTPPQVQDAFGTPGVYLNLGTNELTALDVVGYTVTPAPEPGSLALLVTATATLLGFRRRR